MANRKTDSLDEYVSVDFSLQSSAIRREPDDYVLQIQGIIRLLIDEDDVEIGTMRGFLAQAGAGQDEGWSVYEILDSRQETCAYLEFYKDDNLLESISREFEVSSLDLLILDRIEIANEYRGRGFGLLAARTFIESFAPGLNLVGCKPFPLQFEGYNGPNWKAPNGREKAFSAARESLQRYWGRLGFRRVPGTDLFALSTAFQLPTLKQLLKRTMVH